MALTRDSQGWAMKMTYAEVNGEGREIFKDPKTSNGLKKSARGLLRVDSVNGRFVLRDRVTKEDERGGELKTVFLNGEILDNTSFEEIRNRLASYE